MNESLLRDFHDAQIEELTALKAAIKELAARPTASPTDVAKVQMMLSNIKLPAQDNSVATEALRQLKIVSEQLTERHDDQAKWLQAIYKYCKSLNERTNSDTEVMAQGIEEFKRASNKINDKVFNFKLSNFATLAWAIGMTLMCSYCLYEWRTLGNQVAKLKENSLKYRYIKMKGEATPKHIADIEDIFEYNRDYDKIIEMQKHVSIYEEALRKKALLDEQTRLQKLESERLRIQTDELKKR
ncbi:MAG: hypothetical protein SNI70_06020 [Rikenellaceae bacterium]